MEEDVLEKLTAGGFFSSSKYKWESRFVVCTPTNVLYFKNAQAPITGEKPKADLYLGEGARVEIVEPGELPVRCFYRLC